MKLIESWTNRTHHRIFRDGNIGASVIPCPYAPTLLEVIGVHFLQNNKYRLSTNHNHEILCFEDELEDTLNTLSIRMKE